jgi:hypothetical protein
MAHLNAFEREGVMKNIAVRIAVLYLVDWTCVDGKYFNATTAVISHILNGF